MTEGTGVTDVVPVGRPVTSGAVLRADARRNRARVLEAAQVAFATEGFSVPLSEIARRAGVGAGTVYRHFPTKQALFEAVAHGRIRQLIADGHALASAEDPGAAFFGFFFDLVEKISFNKALAEALERNAGVRLETVPSIQRDFRDIIGVLLRRAQESGQVRPDIDVADAVAIAVGCVTMERRRRASGRLVSVVADALRADVAAARAPVRSTSGAKTVERGGTKKSAGVPQCATCGAAIPLRTTGRPARYCGQACRQRAHRKRRKLAQSS